MAGAVSPTVRSSIGKIEPTIQAYEKASEDGNPPLWEKGRFRGGCVMFSPLTPAGPDTGIQARGAEVDGCCKIDMTNFLRQGCTVYSMLIACTEARTIALNWVAHL